MRKFSKRGKTRQCHCVVSSSVLKLPFSCICLTLLKKSSPVVTDPGKMVEKFFPVIPPSTLEAGNNSINSIVFLAGCRYFLIFVWHLP